MKELKENSWLKLAGLLVVALLVVSGCTSGVAIKTLAPIKPPENEVGEIVLPDDIVLNIDNPEEFKIPAKGPILSMTKDNVTVAISYWRRADLDRKYNRGNTASPFFETEALHQGEKTDVFYLKITNNAETKVVYRAKGTRDVPAEVIDQGDNRYGVLDYGDLEERLKFMTRIGGLYVKNGLAKAREILLERRIGKSEDGIPPGGSIEGFLPFQQTKSTAEELKIVIPLELAPAEGSGSRYKRLKFEFPYVHNKGIRIAQPRPTRY